MKQKKQPKVSIIVLTWNGLQHLHDCLTAIKKQSYKNIEPIVIDNGSTDGSIEFIKKKFPKFKLIENGENVGFCKGNNIGVHQSTGKYVVFLSNDTELEKEFTKELVTFAEKAPKDVGMLSGKLLLFDKRDRLNSAALKMYDEGSSVDEGIYEKDDGRFDAVKEIFGPCGGAAFYKRETLEDIRMGDDYFDSDIFIYCDDSDLAFRSRLRGWKCFFVPSARVYHKLRATTSKRPEFSVYLGLRNKCFLIIKDFPLPLLIKKAPKILFRQILSMIYYAPRYFKASFKARIDVIRYLPKMLKKRKVIQKRRKVTSEYIESILVKRGWFSQK